MTPYTENESDDRRTLDVPGVHGRDAGKRFVITEIDTFTLSGYMLRLVAALRVGSYEMLLERLGNPTVESEAPIDAVMQVLQGADPDAVHKLIGELLAFVQVAADPKHPDMLRRITVADIREIRTLGAILTATTRLNFVQG